MITTKKGDELEVINCILLWKHKDNQILGAYRHSTHEQESQFIYHQTLKDASCIKVHC